MRVSRLFAAIVIAGGSAAYFTSCTGREAVSTANGSEPEVRPGGVLRVSYISEPKTYNRYVSAKSPEDGIARLTQATLLRLNRATAQLEARLAKEWTSSPDGLTWTLKLRDDIKFSDGTPFTSADVIFSFRALYDPAVNSPIASSLRINDKPLQVRALDSHTVVIVLPAPFGPGISLLDAVPILPRHKLEAALEAGKFQDAWGLATPLSEVVGLGPFALSEHAPGQRIVLVRNPHFWRKDGRGHQLPYLDRIEIQFSADQNAEVLRLESGDLDVMFSPVRFEDLSALRALEAKKQISLHTAGVSIAPDMLWFNLVPKAAAADHRPWLQSEALRKAVSTAVDRQALVNTVFLGEAVPIAGPITPGHGEWYSPDAARPVFDREASRQALSSAGLTDRNGDGFVDDASGRTAKFSILTQKGNSVRQRSAEFIQDQLRKAGIMAEVAPMEVRSMLEAWNTAQYDAIFFAIEFDSLDPARHLDFWSSSGSFHFWNPGQLKPSTTWEAALDELMKRQSTSIEPVERRRLFQDAQRVLAEHQPVLYFAAPKVILATSARVRGAAPSVLAPHLLWNAEMLSVTGPPAK